MAAANFTPVTWTNEPVSSTKLQTMANNEQWLYENSVKLDYNVNGIQRSSGLKIMVAYIYIPGNGARFSSNRFYFGDFFTPGTMPAIVGGNFSQWVVDTSFGFKGIDQWMPDHRGIEAWVTHPIAIPTALWVCFAAIGI